jgi:hypothetical protein
MSQYVEEEQVVYHMNVMNENGFLVDLTNAEVVVGNAKHGVIQIRFNSPPAEIKDRRVCLYCGANRPREEYNCGNCGAPDTKRE